MGYAWRMGLPTTPTPPRVCVSACALTSYDPPPRALSFTNTSHCVAPTPRWTNEAVPRLQSLKDLRHIDGDAQTGASPCPGPPTIWGHPRTPGFLRVARHRLLRV